MRLDTAAVAVVPGAEPVDLVIFDCDGVLVDSETISIGVLIEVIAEAGRAIPEHVAYSRFLGRSTASVVAILNDEFGLAITDVHLDQIRQTLVRRFGAELRPVPGIGETLAALRTARCVASSSQLERLRLSLSLTGLLDLFEPHIYSASMVKHGKPAPDLFLHAARTMGVDPRRCLVIEDSPAGIAAAHAAGMRVFGFTGGSHAAQGMLGAELRASAPTLIFEHMRQLPGLIEAMQLA